jgi:hypothetical protein
LGAVREFIKKLPVIPSVYRALNSCYIRNRLKSKSTEDVFTDIYRNNVWEGQDSVSGPGSGTHQTGTIAREISALLKELNISSMLDIPCGDFGWMKSVEMNGIDYIGADIVKDLIHNNSAKYTKDGIRFRSLNLIKDNLPKVDLILCRDCLVHFSFADIELALSGICNSQSNYFLTTTFTGRKENHDIVTGEWRTINLELSPFRLPKALKIINERCTEGDGAYEDKALALWRIADIRECRNHSTKA